MAKVNVLLTRQDNQNLAAKIAAQGGTSIGLPLFAIESVLDQKSLAALHTKLSQCSLAICISRNAGEIVLPNLHKEEKNMTWATVGPGTARCLQQYGIKTVLYPASPPYDSAALMQVLKLNNISLQNQYIMVFTGENGDDWLSAALQQRQANVERVPLYKRVMPPISSDLFIKIFNSQPGIDIILITCITSLVNLMKLANAAEIQIRQQPLLVVSQRIYNYAVAQGFKEVYTAKSMSEEDILSALVDR